MSAQSYSFRYVSTAGDFNNDGLSWASAKNNLQNAIDELYEQIRGTSKKGYVFVAGSEEGMTFVPSRRSTSDADGSVFNTSFSIYPGITVYGGFKGDEVPDAGNGEETLPGKRIMTNDERYDAMEAKILVDDLTNAVRRWNFKYKTILSGNHSTNSFSFTYNESRGIYNTSFPLSSYHVVWFATNGKITPDPAITDETSLTGHYAPLTGGQAVLDGVTIEGGYASSTNLKGHDHTGFGGGVYMVKGAVIRNCIIQYCAATQRGGAVYMDGGGEMERCYIHTSQVTGYGMQQGYGGGICIDYDGAVRHAYIIQCAARIGAGLAICHVPDEYPEKSLYPNEADRATPYTPYASGMVVSNCTSNAEGGGVYLDEGGTLNHCTVVNNKCVGPDVIYYGRRHARTGGIYVRNRGTLYNSVAWGNSSPVNNDVQFASFKDAEAEAAGKRIALYYCAFSRSDITDWSTATKENIVSLTNENTPETKDAAGNFPLFYHPTWQMNEDGTWKKGADGLPLLAAGIQHDADGKVHPEQRENGQPYQRVYNWHPMAASKLRQKGVQVTDALQGISSEVIHAHITTDIIGRQYEAISAVGALAHSYRSVSLTSPIKPSLEKGEEGTLIPTLLVDPNRKAWGPENDKEYDGSGNLVNSPELHAGYMDDNVTGDCWEHPIGNLGNAIRTLRRRQWTSGTKKDWYNLGGTKNADGTFTGGTDYKHAQIIVKEGSITTAGPDCYLGNEARTASIRPASNMRIYGSFPQSLTGTTVEGRNERLTPTRVSANVLNSTFMNNGAHVFALINVHDVIIDGFRILDGNANLTAEHSYSHEAISFGGGLIINNTSRPIAERIDMTGNILRNSVIANCAAPEGSAIYVNGTNPKTDGTRCRAELSVINCIVRNTTAGDMKGDTEWFTYKDGKEEEDAATGTDPNKNHKTNAAVVTANGNAHIWLRNCDIMNNCGYAMKGLNSNFPTDGDMFQIEIYNSIIFSNGRQIRGDRMAVTEPVTCKWSEQRSIIGNYIYIDWDAQKPPVPGDVKCYNYLTPDRQKDRTYATTDGTATGTPLPSYVDVYGNQMYATEHGDISEKPLLLHYPYFVNPSRNVGHSESGDQPLYGGFVNYEPLNLNPLVNGACPGMETDTGAADLLPVNNTMVMTGSSPETMMPVADPSNLYHHNCKAMAYDSALEPRTYGGAPDAGAIEGVRLPKGGTVIYVTPDGAGKRDGSSWSNAIAGNTVYLLDDVPGPALASGDQIDSEPTCDRILDSEGNPVLTTDEKYCGGFGRVWLTDKKTGGITNTIVTNTWITERNVYIGGTKNGLTEIVSDGSTPTEIINTTIVSGGSTPAGFKAGYEYDSRYPYGEISGGSRSFWRANPYHNGADWNNASAYADVAAFITACNTNGWINNSRQERYLSGLQYAVEKAAAYNALAENDAQRIADVDSIMVWVGNGKYTDYKGFIMRDNTTVMGSFPVTKGGTPGMSERQALMSGVIDIPKSLPAQDLEATDYETILQISDTDPKTDNETLNEDAVKYWDDDYSVVENTNTQSYEYKNRSITHHYTLVSDSEEDITNNYILYPAFTNSTNENVIASDRSSANDVDGIRYYDFGTATDDKDCWHISYPNKANNVGGAMDQTKNYTIYDTSGNVISNPGQSGKWAFIRDGSLTGVNFWQTIPSVPVGEYHLRVDIGGGYRNSWTDVTHNTNIDFFVLDGNGNVLATQHIPNSTGGRERAVRYILDVNQTTAGAITLKMVVGEGTRGTGENGADPATIPAYGSNPNRREFWISNVKLYRIIRGTEYVETSTDDETTDRVVDDPEPAIVTSQNTYTLQTHRTTLRKRVLTMPDVCVPTYGAGGVGDPVGGKNRGKFGDDLSHTDRVWGSNKANRTSTTRAKEEDPHYVEYNDVYWDGFTIRHGFIADEGMGHGGGAGVNMYEGGHLRNCIVINNMAYSERVKGCGIFCDGSSSTIEGCFVLDNTSTHGTKNQEQDQIFAGGMFMYEGTCFNSLFAKNYSYGSAGGVGFCVGRFFNNTIAYNICNLQENGQYSGGAISLATASNPNLFLANTIIFGNNGIAIRDRNSGVGTVNPFLHCYVQSEVAQPNNTTKQNVNNWTSSSKSNYGIGNVFLNGVAPSAANTPFAADISSGSYNADNPGAKVANDFRLTSDLQDCINKGTEDFSGTLFTALRYKGKSESDIRNSFIYKSVDAAVLPENDVAFAHRVQDCQIDMGAYEFDGSKFIEPDLSEDGKAIFYVSQNGGNGLATAATPEDAACMVKLQKVLDAAGRWKYAANYYMNTDPEGTNYNLTNFSQSILEAEITKAARMRGDIAANANLTTDQMNEWLTGLKDRTVIVKLAGDYYHDGAGNYTPTFFKYAPTRSTVTDDTHEDNLLEYSFMVPRGVQVLGGYTAEAVLKNDGSGMSWPAFDDATRDALGNHTRLSGEVINEETGATGNTFHVVTFVEDLYDPNEKLYMNSAGTEQLTGQLSVFTDEKDRAVLDGLYIQDGFANGTDDKDRRGAGAIVTDFAHIRNCIVQFNEASGEGGGLYLEPAALVSGCIIKENTAYSGGGIFVEEPATVTSDTYARIITSTVVFNTAQTVAGGMHFETNVRANSSAFWKNTANDLSNVAGTFTNEGTQVEENCPFNYCGVESRRISGVNNIELPVAENEGVRWNHSEPHEVMRWNVYGVNRSVSTTLSDSIYYYPINVSSVLGRAGMTYAAYEKLCMLYPTMELTDISGLNRLAQTTEGERIRMADGNYVNKELKDNSFIEMGARVLNGTFEVHVEYAHVMTRLFVTTTQQLPSEQALTLQNNPATDDDAEMYRQMGSSFLNPYHRLGDALEYIIRVRSSNAYVDGVAANGTIGDKYKDVRFEVFVSSGTFYPFRDAHGNQGEARANTFVVPEEVTIVGGVNPTGHPYCQATSGTLTVAGLTLDGVSTEDIRAARERMDRNGNHVKEPWELSEQTILSGNAVNNAGSGNTNVYHVITCFSDQTQVGKLPTRWQEDADVTAFNSGTPNKSAVILDALYSDVLPIEGAQRVLLENIEAECRNSLDRRTIFLDGLTITGGHANDIEDEDAADNFQKLTYFRGGGILVEGNWDDSFNDKVDLPEVLGVAKRNIPLITTNCLFQDNLAGNGGAVYTNGTYYAFGCHFTKNTACGPNTLTDQKYIPWTAGGAIANNYQVHVWNSLFDNNEAKRGAFPITNGTITNADARQGYAGAISCSETGLVRAGNCDFVRNKAVAFPAIYNFIDNNLRAYSGVVHDDYEKYEKLYPKHDGTMTPSMGGTAQGYDYFKQELDDFYYGKGHHFAVNTIFWGNEATASSVNAFSWQEYGYYNWRQNDYYLPPEYSDDTEHNSDYFSKALGIDGRDPWTDSRKPNHVANFGPLLDIATLTFCALEEGTGREGTVWYDNQDRAKAAQITDKGGVDGLTRLYAGDFLDVLYNEFGFYPDGYPGRPFYKKTDLGGGIVKIEPCAPSTSDDCWILDTDGTTERHPTAAEVASAIAYNYNLVLDPENLDPNGPYFVQPSISSGADGYMENADWLVARLNRTIDTGWGMLKQDVTQESATSGLYTTTLKDKNGDNVTSETDQYEQLWGEGFYNLHSKNIHERFQDIGFPNLMPIGDDPYMEYTTEGTSVVRNMRRISTHPKMGVQDVFIDMGIYEYQYVQLVTGGDQTDVIWVAETQDQGEVCDGSTWKKATSDLQTAIETLLLSRNEHDKMLKIRGGHYSPFRLTDGNQKAFFINVPSNSKGVVLPAGVQDADKVNSVRSITIRGGYSNEDTPDYSDGESTRDIEQNPTVLQMYYEDGNTDHQLEHLFIIEDAERKGTFINYLTADNPSFTGEAMPIMIEGITFINPYGNNHHEDGGAALYYETQYHTTPDEYGNFVNDPDQLLKPSLDSNGNPMPKLVIKNCIFMANGKDDVTSAVRIDKGGGEALIVNSLFHSNSAVPIEAVNTKLVNCTFALNGGHLTLKDEREEYHDGTHRDYASAMHNSIVWRDDQNNSEATQYQYQSVDGNTVTDITATKWGDGSATGNAYTKVAEEPDGQTVSDAHDNHLLSKVNDDVLLGPNFKQPYVTIPGGLTDKEQLAIKTETRDFHVGPSAHVLNRANAATYIANVRYYPEVSTQEQKELDLGDGLKKYYWFHSVQHQEPSTLTEAHLKGIDEDYQERELAHKYRWLNAGIERGAYECTAHVDRVVYVIDGAVGTEDGTSWLDAYDLEDLQKALDVASVYSLTNNNERAYVFVKSSETVTDALKLRDGVSVYGSLPVIFPDMVVKDEAGNKYNDADIEIYIQKVLASRSGIAAQHANHNTVKGLLSENNSDYVSGFMLDGFWISGGTTAATPVNMVKDNTMVRNCVITGNTVTGSGQPVVNLQKGLLYNTLVYGNTAGSGAPVASVGTNGYALNNTIVAPSGATPLAFTGLSGETSAHLQNNIALAEATGTRQVPFAPYMRPLAQGGNTGLDNTLPNYLTSHRPYWYQLHEESNEIDAGTDDGGTGVGSTAKDGGNSIAKLFPDYVDFSHDRDLLGNPRRLRGRVDNGCFETWRITGSKYVTNVTNIVPLPTPEENQSQYEANHNATGYYDRPYGYTTNYGGHLYPHDGSVVYLDQDASMVVSTDEGTPLFSDETPLQPGYVLVKKGASVYGQGNKLHFGYVAAEHEYTSQRYALMAFPYPYAAADAFTTAYNSSTDVLTQTNAAPANTYVYDGEARSDYRYDFHRENSECWNSVDRKLNAAEGSLFDFGSAQSKTIRFTGWAESEGSYIYEEDGTDHKLVTLTQYNNNHVADGTNYPRFTKLENMGWNLKGHPWLVSRFVTGGTNPDFKMNVPHLFYGMNGSDGSYIEKTEGLVYTSRSWDSDVSLTLGEAVFTQTAIIGDTENLSFKRPEPDGLSPVAPTRLLVAVAEGPVSTDGRLTPHYADYIEVCPHENADPSMPYCQGSDGVKWLGFNGQSTQLYLLSGDGAPLSLSSQTPIDVDMPLGLKVSSTATQTFLLPQPALFADYAHVWLTDHETGQVTDLMEHEYTFAPVATGFDDERFTLRIGGVRPVAEERQDCEDYIIYTRGHRLTIKNLRQGDLIQVYTVGGALRVRTTATSSEYHCDLYDGTYVVRVNNTVKKLDARR